MIPTTALSLSVRSHSWLGVYSLSSGTLSNVIERKDLAGCLNPLTVRTGSGEFSFSGLTRDANRVIDLSSMKWRPMATNYQATTVTTGMASAGLSELIELPDRPDSEPLGRVEASR